MTIFFLSRTFTVCAAGGGSKLGGSGFMAWKKKKIKKGSEKGIQSRRVAAGLSQDTQI